LDILLDTVYGGGSLTSTGRDDNLSCFFMKQEGTEVVLKSFFCFVKVDMLCLFLLDYDCFCLINDFEWGGWSYTN